MKNIELDLAKQIERVICEFLADSRENEAVAVAQGFGVTVRTRPPARAAWAEKGTGGTKVARPDRRNS